MPHSKVTQDITGPTNKSFIITWSYDQKGRLPLYLQHGLIDQLFHVLKSIAIYQTYNEGIVWEKFQGASNDIIN